MASTKLTRTPSSAGNRQKYTISFWVKRSSLGNQFLFNTDGGNEETYLRFKSGDSLQWFEQNSSAATQANRSTNALFRDTNAWYHIVITRDSTLSTANDRLKFYINGVLNTSWAEDATPAQNTNTRWNNNVEHMIGVGVNGSSNYFDGYMSHIHFCDGYAYAASDFGSTDATTGEWKINTSPNVSYGTNGFFILKNDNGVTDQSPNTNNFTISGTLTKSEDCPSNVFATLNPLANENTSGTSLSNGNNTFTTPSGGHDFSVSTLAMNSGSGKFYAEFKVSTNAAFNMIGISDHNYQGNNEELSQENYSYGYYSDSGGSYGNVRGNSSTLLSNMPNYTTNDIIGVAVDLENHKLYFSKNGTWINSGDPTSGSTGTGAVSINNLNTTPNSHARGQGVYFFGVGDWTTTGAGAYQCNFGNGYFGTTAVSSAGTNASNNGIFEYDVPTGYTALSTKGLNE